MSNKLSKEEVEKKFHNALNNYRRGLIYNDIQCFATAFQEWELLANEYEHFESKYMLAVMYRIKRAYSGKKDDGVDYNNIAFDCFNKLDDYPPALFSLGEMHEDEVYFTKNEKIATKFYRKAAERGHRKAQYNLAMKYKEGNVLPKSSIHAYIWFSVAKCNGYEAADAKLEELEKELSGSGDLVRAQERAADFYETLFDKECIDYAEN